MGRGEADLTSASVMIKKSTSDLGWWAGLTAEPMAMIAEVPELEAREQRVDVAHRLALTLGQRRTTPKTNRF